MKKKLLLIALMVVVMVCAFAISASAIEVGGIYYFLDNNNMTAAVTNENEKGTLEIVKIPETITIGEGENAKTYTVTKIDSSAFGAVDASAANKTIKEVTIPSTVSAIGSHAFRNCTSLVKVTCNASNGSFTLSNAEFMYCSALKEVDMSKSTGLTSIGSNAFTFCTNLETVYLPKGLVYISGNSFSGLSNLKTVVFPTSNPQTLKEISGKQAFSSTGLKDVALPYGLEKLGNNIFQYSTVETVVIPATVTHVGEHCFNNAKSLKYVVIANTDVTNYNNAMFYESAVDLIFFAGSKSDAQTFAERLSKASFTNFISYDEYLQDPTKTYIDTIVYGTRNCSACSNIVGDAALYDTGVATKLQEKVVCTCGAETVVKEYDVPVKFLGVSINELGTSICIGYQIDYDALENYEILTSKEISFGVVAYAPKEGEDVSTLKPVNDDLTLKDAETTIFASLSGTFASFEFKLTGFDNTTKDTALVMCAFVNDGSAVSYLNVGSNGVAEQSAYASTLTFSQYE